MLMSNWSHAHESRIEANAGKGSMGLKSGPGPGSILKGYRSFTECPGIGEVAHKDR